jgi:hypothetical protein
MPDDPKPDLLGVPAEDWIAVLEAFRRSRARGMHWSRGEVARALHRLDRAVGKRGEGDRRG